MTRNRTRVAIPLLVVAAMLLSLSFAAVAFASGDSQEHATLLTPGTNVTETLYPGVSPSGFYYFRVELNAGKTLKAKFTSVTGASNIKVLVMPDKANYRFVESSATPTGAQLMFMAPTHGMFTLWVTTDTTGTIAVEPSLVGAVKYSLKSFSAPTKAKVHASIPLSVKVTPGYDGPLVPIKFVIQRRVSGTWKSYKTVSAHFYNGDPSFTQYKASASVSRTGTFRVRAKFDDPAPGNLRYTSYKTIAVT